MTANRKLGIGDRENGQIAPISVPKASDILADRLRQIILSGEIEPGESLPPERELVKSSGLSRSSVRDALRVLEVEGLIITKPGRAGGSVVQLPGRESIARSMQLFVMSNAIQLNSLLDCRIAIEPFLAAKAAENHTEEELEEIRRINDEFVATTDNIATYKRLNLEWHLAVARASGNEILTALMEAISQPILDTDGYQQVTTDKARQEAKRAHTGIIKAIAARDPELASRRMAAHVGAYAKVVSKIGTGH